MSLGDLITNRKFILIVLFMISSVFVLSFPYPLQERPNGMWDGGTIPDEHAYFGWAWIYYKTGKTYVPLEDVGRTKIQHLDFFIGNTPESCVFVKIDVSASILTPAVSPGEFLTQNPVKPQSPIKPGVRSKWEVRPRDVTVTVYNGYNTGISGAHIVIREKSGLRFEGVSDREGKFTARVPPGFYTVTVFIKGFTKGFEKGNPLKLTFATDFFNLDYPILATPALKSLSNGTKAEEAEVAEVADVNIHVDHYINKNLEGVKIYIREQGKLQKWQDKKPVGYTDKSGNFTLTLPAQRIYHVVVVKETENIIPPVGSVIVEVDGGYAIANRWYPGYSYFIIPFWLTGAINFINIFNCFIASASVYLLSRRLYNKETAFYATLLVITSGLGMMMIYSRGMADYASMAFSTAGIALFIESIYSERAMNSFLAFIGGLSFAFAIAARYSAAAIIIALVVYILIRFVRNSASSFISIYSLKKALPILFFILGLFIVGSLLAYYNTTLFGSPLSSGYQMSHRLEIVNGNVTIKTPKETMIERYLHPSWKSISSSLKLSLPQLFLLLTPLFIAPIGFLLDFRRSRAWLLFFWGFIIFFLYLQLGGVGIPPYEEMRYFLPVLPPAAVLSAHAISYILVHLKNRPRMSVFMHIQLVLLVILGFLMAYCGIFWQLHRREIGMVFNPPFIAYIMAGVVVLSVYWVTVKFFVKDFMDQGGGSEKVKEG